MINLPSSVKYAVHPQGKLWLATVRRRWFRAHTPAPPTTNETRTDNYVAWPESPVHARWKLPYAVEVSTSRGSHFHATWTYCASTGSFVTHRLPYAWAHRIMHFRAPRAGHVQPAVRRRRRVLVKILQSQHLPGYKLNTTITTKLKKKSAYDRDGSGSSAILNTISNSSTAEAGRTRAPRTRGKCKKLKNALKLRRGDRE